MTDIDELRRLLAEANRGYPPRCDSACVALRNAVPELLDELETLRKVALAQSANEVELARLRRLSDAVLAWQQDCDNGERWLEVWNAMHPSARLGR